MSHLKLFVLCICGVLLLAQYAPAAQNMVKNPGFEEPNTVDAALVCNNWRRTSTNGVATIQASRLAGGGEAASASLNLVTIGAAGASSSNNGAWQIIPVTQGKTYQIRGKWRGSIMAQQVNGSDAAVEVYVGFYNSPTTRAPSANETMIYRKRYNYADTGVNLNNTMNIDPNSGTWDWEEISDSINLGWAGGDLVTATNTHMTIRVQMNTANQSATEYVDFDNMRAITCNTSASSADFNDDCALDFQDVAILANNWLVCGITPQSMCW